VGHIPYQLGEGLAAYGLNAHTHVLRALSQIATADVIARLRNPEFEETLRRPLEHRIDRM
jgi:hypothetical protein